MYIYIMPVRFPIIKAPSVTEQSESLESSPVIIESPVIEQSESPVIESVTDPDVTDPDVTDPPVRPPKTEPHVHRFTPYRPRSIDGTSLLDEQSGLELAHRIQDELQQLAPVSPLLRPPRARSPLVEQARGMYNASTATAGAAGMDGITTTKSFTNINEFWEWIERDDVLVVDDHQQLTIPPYIITRVQGKGGENPRAIPMTREELFHRSRPKMLCFTDLTAKTTIICKTETLASAQQEKQIVEKIKDLMINHIDMGCDQLLGATPVTHINFAGDDEMSHVKLPDEMVATIRVYGRGRNKIALSLYKESFKNLIDCVEKMHEEQLWHVDIKFPNMVFSFENKVYLIDYGSAIEDRNLGDDSPEGQALRHDRISRGADEGYTVNYTSPFVWGNMSEQSAHIRNAAVHLPGMNHSNGDHELYSANDNWQLIQVLYYILFGETTLESLNGKYEAGVPAMFKAIRDVKKLVGFVATIPHVGDGKHALEKREFIQNYVRPSEVFSGSVGEEDGEMKYSDLMDMASQYNRWFTHNKDPIVDYACRMQEQMRAPEMGIAPQQWEVRPEIVGAVGGGKRNTNKRKTNKRKTNKRKTKKRKTKKRKTNKRKTK